LPGLTRTLQLRWQSLSPALAPLIAKSSWLPATHQDPQGWLRTSTLKTSPPTSYLPRHQQMRPPPTEKLDVNATGSAANGAGVSGITSPSATSRKLSRRSRAEYTLPLSNASCRHGDRTSGSGHTRWRGHRQARRRCLLHAGRQQGQPASPRQAPRQRSYKSQRQPRSQPYSS
jgi:hypothetical protein